MTSFSYSMNNFRNNNNQLKVVPRPQLTKIISQDEHKVTEYGMLNRVVMNHLKKKKKKKTKPIMTFRQQFINQIDHCRSLDKMQSVNSERNEQIKRHIHEKARMFTQNEELRQMLVNPSLKQHELHKYEVNNLKHMLEQKDSKHAEEIKKLKQRHRQEIQILNNRINNKYQGQNQYNTNTTNYSVPQTNVPQYQQQANHIKAINYNPPNNVNYNPPIRTNYSPPKQTNNYSPTHKTYEAEKVKVTTLKSYSPSKNVDNIQSYQQNQRPKFVENPNYNPKIISYEPNKNENMQIRTNYSPPKIISNHNYAQKNYTNTINHQSTNINLNQMNNNNTNLINQQKQSITYKTQYSPPKNQPSPPKQQGNQNYTFGAPVYITSKNKQSQQQYANNAKINQNKVSSPKPNLTINTVESKPSLPPSSPSYTPNITTVPYKQSSRTAQAMQYKGYGQNDLQEIYKRYCID